MGRWLLWVGIGTYVPVARMARILYSAYRRTAPRPIGLIRPSFASRGVDGLSVRPLVS